MPPPFEAGPQAKRKRRPRKPKDGSPKSAKAIDGELGSAPGDILQSPALPPHESRVPPTGLEILGHPLPPPSGGQSPIGTPLGPHGHPLSTTPPLHYAGTKSPVRASPEKAGNDSQHIINPYTGQLEPRESRTENALKAEDHKNVNNDSSSSLTDAGSSAGFLDTAPQLRPPSNPMVDIKNRLAANQNPLLQQQTPQRQIVPRQSSPRSELHRPGLSLGHYGPPHHYPRVSTPPATLPGQIGMFPRNSSNMNPLPGGNMHISRPAPLSTNPPERLPQSVGAASPVSIPNSTDTSTPPIISVSGAPGHHRLPPPICSSPSGPLIGQHLPPQVSPMMACPAQSGLPPPPPYTSAAASSSAPQVSCVKSPIAAQATALSSALAAPPLVEPILVPPPRSQPAISVTDNAGLHQQHVKSNVPSSVMTTSVPSSNNNNKENLVLKTVTASVTTPTTTVCSSNVAHDNALVSTSVSSAPLSASSHLHSNAQFHSNNNNSPRITQSTTIIHNQHTPQTAPFQRTPINEGEVNNSAMQTTSLERSVPSHVKENSEVTSSTNHGDNLTAASSSTRGGASEVRTTESNTGGDSAIPLDDSSQRLEAELKEGKIEEDESPADGSLTPASSTSAPTPSTPPTLPNCTGSTVENCLGRGAVEVDVKVDGKGADIKVSQLPVHYPLLQHANPHSEIPSAVPLSAVSMHNDLHGLSRGSNGASTGSASPASDATSSTGLPLSGHSPLTNNIMHDSELSSHSFEDNSPAQTAVGTGVVISRENHNSETQRQADTDKVKDGNRSDADGTAKEQEPHKNVITVGYALSKEPVLSGCGLLSDKLLKHNLKGLGGMPFLTKPGSIDSDNSKGISLSEELLGKKGLLKGPAMIQDGDGRNQEVQESCVDEESPAGNTTKAHLNLTRCISIPSKLLGRTDPKPGDEEEVVHEEDDLDEVIGIDTQPVNGNDNSLSPGLKFNVVGARTASWLTRKDEITASGQLDGEGNAYVPETQKMEPESPTSVCVNHTGSSVASLEPSNIGVQYVAESPVTTTDLPVRQLGSPPKLKGHEDIPEDKTSTVDQHGKHLILIIEFPKLYFILKFVEISI